MVVAVRDVVDVAEAEDVLGEDEHVVMRVRSRRSVGARDVGRGRSRAAPAGARARKADSGRIRSGAREKGRDGLEAIALMRVLSLMRSRGRPPFLRGRR